jgi:acyl-CoA thioester hydrolase
LSKTILSDEKEVQLRFSELDPMGVVWHGNYTRLLEDGRESWGKKFNLDYFTVYEHGFRTPIVHISIDYKNPLRYGDVAVIKTEYIDSDAAKIVFKYTISRKSDRVVVAVAETVQVFITGEGELQLNIPEFVKAWKNQWL